MSTPEAIDVQVAEAIRDTLDLYLPAHLTTLGEGGPPTYSFEPVPPTGPECPVVGIYGDGAEQRIRCAGGEGESPGYSVWDYRYQVWAFVRGARPDEATARAKRWLAAIRAVLEEHYKLGDVVTDTEIEGVQPTASSEFAGGVMQAAGLDIRVVVGRATRSLTLS